MRSGRKYNTGRGKAAGAWLTQMMSALLLFAVSAARAQHVVPPFDSAFYAKYKYIRFIKEGDSVSVSDDDFFDNSARMVFRVNKYNMEDVVSFPSEIEDAVIPQLRRDSLQLMKVLLRGAASPEGPYRFNWFLGSRRANTLLDFLSEKLGQPIEEEMLSSQNNIEDYLSLCTMMHRANDPDYEIVRQLTDRYLPTGRYALLKAGLRQAQGGRLWRRIYRTYYPQLRAARFMLFFKTPSQPEPAVKDTLPLPVVTDTVQVVPTPEPFRPVAVARRELLSVKTNLLFYGVYMPGGYDRWCPIPNVAVEYYPKRGHFTFGASLDMPWWIDYDHHKFFEVRNWQFEARYYLRSGSIEKNLPGHGAAFRGWYFQGYVHTGVFEIGFNRDKGWKGEGFGLGVGAGYVLPLTRKGHWRLEFGVQVGWMTCKYDPFQYENLINLNYHDGLYYYRWRGKAADFKKRQYSFNWLGPTRVGVTLSYDLLYRRIVKRGVSFRSKETISSEEQLNIIRRLGELKRPKKNRNKEQKQVENN